ncbi:hypothetical protein SLEP1_g45472 [Rubroshorea leprosula]|uniref:25S rRNA (uridine-N(3))-methyltransferase BMT5-like domain-containing protein n=1 Tax=Rubroshorea leprosula TaxID=152421 RepID=A0AAV5LJ92_9ROSI|nr:hypothetical protein SLEP1_g45472 [Rubroshorea leprosula]
MEEARKELGVDQKKEEEKWVTHYSSKHKILFVGEGDFSFSLSLAIAFGSGSNICATSLDSEDDVINKYKNAKSNLENLKKRGATILHGVDATKMKNHDDLKKRRKHRTLVSGFFSNASKMLQVNGEIHVNHKITHPFCCWNLEELASANFLDLIESVEFKIGDYRGYNNKRGSGSKCDEPFPLDLCNTYKFRFLNRAKNISRQLHYSPAQMQLQPNTSAFNYSYRKHIAAVNPFPLQPQLPYIVDAMNDCSWNFNTCSNAAFGRDINNPRQVELPCTISNLSSSPRSHIRRHGGLFSTNNAEPGSHINYPIQAGLLPRYHTTNVSHIQPRLELTSTICAGRDIEYRSQAGLQHTFPDFSWLHRDCIADMNHIRLQHTFPDFSWLHRDCITYMNHIQPHVGVAISPDPRGVPRGSPSRGRSGEEYSFPRGEDGGQFNFTGNFPLPVGLRGDPHPREK